MNNASRGKGYTSSDISSGRAFIVNNFPFANCPEWCIILWDTTDRQSFLLECLAPATFNDWLTDAKIIWMRSSSTDDEIGSLVLIKAVVGMSHLTSCILHYISLSLC